MSRTHRYQSIGILSTLLVLVCLSAAVAKDKTPAKDPSAPPADAQFTLYCQAVPGPGHVERANAAKDMLIKLSSMKDWYILHQDGQSIIYYGFYRSISDPKEKKENDRAQADREKVLALTDQQGNKVFTRVLFVEVNTPDPEAPAEWDLTNSGGFWSLQIAAYKDSAQRKQAAVDSVREARAAGIDAFYYHGETTSSVCIGAWPREAVKEQDAAAAESPDDQNDVLVLPAPLAGGNFDIRNRDGQRVRAVAPRTEIVDPTLLAAVKQYPTHAVNQQVMVKKVTDPVTGKEVEQESPSFLVRVPEKKASLLSQPKGPLLVTPTTPSQTPGAGKLKSIDQ